MYVRKYVRVPLNLNKVDQWKLSNQFNLISFQNFPVSLSINYIRHLLASSRSSIQVSGISNSPSQTSVLPFRCMTTYQTYAALNEVETAALNLCHFILIHFICYFLILIQIYL